MMAANKLSCILARPRSCTVCCKVGRRPTAKSRIMSNQPLQACKITYYTIIHGEWKNDLSKHISYNIRQRSTFFKNDVVKIVLDMCPNIPKTVNIILLRNKEGVQNSCVTFLCQVFITISTISGPVSLWHRGRTHKTIIKYIRDNDIITTSWDPCSADKTSEQLQILKYTFFK